MAISIVTSDESGDETSSGGGSWEKASDRSACIYFASVTAKAGDAGELNLQLDGSA